MQAAPLVSELGERARPPLSPKGSELGEWSVAREHAAAAPPEGGLGERPCERRGKVARILLCKGARR